MAPDKKDVKKRKAAAPVVSDPPTKKTKNEAKSEQTGKDATKPVSKKKKNASTPSKQGIDEDSASTVKANGEQAKQTKPRKRAADFLTDDEDTEPQAATSKAQEKSKKEKSGSKKAKKDDDVPPAVNEQAPKAEKNNSKKPKTEKKAKKVDEVSDEENDESSASGSGAEENENGEDDQTVALLKGFESSGDEDASGDEGYDPSQPVPRIPDSKKIKRKLLKKQKKSSNDVEEPGTIYIGRIPHGFYEHQMRAYFSQFGDITHLRLSRNRLTGRSKHYAFIEFSSSSVAKIAAETMDNYLMFGHILKCKFIPQKQVHPELWKGADRRFKRTPWNRVEKKQLEQGKSRDKWSKSIAAEEKKRLSKAEKLKALGYEMELPKLTSVDEVLRKEVKAIEASEQVPEGKEPTKAVEASTEEAEGKKDTSNNEPKPKEDKKVKKVTKEAAEPSKEEGKSKKTEKSKTKKTKAKA